MKDKLNNDVILIKASSLSTEDSFMKHFPKSDNEDYLLYCLKNRIKGGKIKDFYCLLVPMRFEEGIKIEDTLISGYADGVTFYEWNKIAHVLKPSKYSRIGGKEDYILMLGASIKALINKGWKEDDAWDAICNNPEKLLQSKEDWPGILLLTNLLKSRIMLDMFPSNDVAFSIVKTEENLFSFIDVSYQLSEYDYAVENYFNDYTFPCDKSPFQDTLDSLSKESTDVKEEKWKATAWIIMNAD